MKNKAGEAYAFFNCNASIQEIEGELPAIREAVGTPSELELSLTQGTDKVTGDEKLIALAQEAKESGINYTLRAEYYGGTNTQAADELASVINQAYQSQLYRANEPFSGQIVHEENGNYVFRN